jgi:hypothetical protein
MAKFALASSGAFIVRSMCECEAELFAEVDRRHRVARGWIRSDDQQELPAPACVVAEEGRSYSIVWLCPMCLRNTLRCFDGSVVAR